MKNTFSWREFFIRRLNALAVLSLAAAIARQLGAAHWFAELFAHFMPYYAAVFLLAALFRGGRRRWLWAACVFVCAFWLMQPFEIHRPSETRHSLVWYNVNLNNPQPQAETAALLDADADILALAEIDLADTGWVQLRRHYPYGCERESDSPFALAVWSRQPLSACEVRFSGGYPYIRAVSGDTVVYALHPPPPISSTLAQHRADYLRDTARAVAAENKAVVAGDMNSSPFSPLYRRFAAEAGIRAQTRFYLPTWKPFFLNIDHVFAKNTHVRVRPLPWMHSDHRALSATW